jgi:uncharacterized SAM-binding protein YcdF (DUF218 family)
VQPVIAWNDCPVEPLAWINLRELLLMVLFMPALLLPLVAAASALLAWRLHLHRSAILALALLTPLATSTIYSPAATTLLSAWLQNQLPAPSAVAAGLPVVVLVGRGPDIAAASTATAAPRLSQGQALAAYVSGDKRSTAELLQRLGVAPSRISGDSCARTTWENATLTAAWLQQHHPGAPVLLITDPWQLPRASRAFVSQGLHVTPLAAEPNLDGATRNRLALRETAATLLYRLQGRF